MSGSTYTHRLATWFAPKDANAVYETLVFPVTDQGLTGLSDRKLILWSVVFFALGIGYWSVPIAAMWAFFSAYMSVLIPAVAVAAKPNREVLEELLVTPLTSRDWTQALLRYFIVATLWLAPLYLAFWYGSIIGGAMLAPSSSHIASSDFKSIAWWGRQFLTDSRFVFFAWIWYWSILSGSSWMMMMFAHAAIAVLITMVVDQSFHHAAFVDFDTLRLLVIAAALLCVGSAAFYCRTRTRIAIFACGLFSFLALTDLVGVLRLTGVNALLVLMFDCIVGLLWVVGADRTRVTVLLIAAGLLTCFALPNPATLEEWQIPSSIARLLFLPINTMQVWAVGSAGDVSYCVTRVHDPNLLAGFYTALLLVGGMLYARVCRQFTEIIRAKHLD